MNYHIGVAFCVENIAYSIFLKEDQNLVLDRVGVIDYPFQYQESEYFSENNISILAHLLRNSFDELQIKLSGISISIESNLVNLKRIAFPENLEEKEIVEHICWDLSETLPASFDQYVYMRTDNYFDMETVKRELVISIPKKIIEFYQKLMNFAKIELNNLSVHHLSAEIAAQKALGDKISGLSAIFKISSNRLETTYLLNGNFLSSHYERLLRRKKTVTFEDIILDKISARIKLVENLLEQYGSEQKSPQRILIYGDEASGALVEKISSNFSVEVTRFDPFQNIILSENFRTDISDQQNGSKYVECIGVALDI